MPKTAQRPLRKYFGSHFPSALLYYASVTGLPMVTKIARRRSQKTLSRPCRTCGKVTDHKKGYCSAECFKSSRQARIQARSREDSS